MTCVGFEREKSLECELRASKSKLAMWSKLVWVFSYIEIVFGICCFSMAILPVELFFKWIVVGATIVSIVAPILCAEKERRANIRVAVIEIMLSAQRNELSKSKSVEQ